MMTISELNKIKAEGRKFVAVSCYDYTSAKLVAAAGVEVLIVGDSAAQFVLGLENTLGITMDFMVAITAAVKKAAPDCLIVADLPYESCIGGTEKILNDAQRFVSEARADIIKIETSFELLHTLEKVIEADIAVMPHIGIRPQTGKYKAEGITADDAMQLIKLANEVQQLGAEMLLLEGVAKEVAEIITNRMSIPVIGCGSGPNCDGQVLVLPDILNLVMGGKTPKFSKSFADLGKAYIDAIATYADEVRKGIFPDDAHCYHMKAGEYGKLRKLID